MQGNSLHLILTAPLTQGHTAVIGSDPSAPISILIVDDVPATAHGLSRIVAEHPRAHVFAEHASLAAALAEPVEHIDICILGLADRITDGIDPITSVHATWPDAKVVVFSPHDDDEHLEACLQRGAAGFLPRSASLDDVRTAVARVEQGGRYFQPGVGSPRPPVQVSEPPRLTTREHEVLVLLEQGLSQKAMAARLAISPKTINSHKMKLQKKVGAHNTAQIVPCARRWGLI